MQQASRSAPQSAADHYNTTAAETKDELTINKKAIDRKAQHYPAASSTPGTNKTTTTKPKTTPNT
jgi:hypothetical protein